jgi:nucleotide-binding universal stress UspA family protein
MSASAVRGAFKIPLTAWGFTEIEPASDGGRSAFKRILLAVTNSDPCRRAIALVATLARTNSSEVCVIHLYERLSLGKAGFWDLETQDEANWFLGRVRAELERTGVRVEVATAKTFRDEIALRIMSAASEYRADVVVIGTHRKSALQAVLRGSVSHEFIHRSKIPILVVP